MRSGSSRHCWSGLRCRTSAPSGSGGHRGVLIMKRSRRTGGMYCTGCGPKAQTLSLTRCLNSADRLPLLDSSMFMTLVLVPRMLNFLDLR